MRDPYTICSTSGAGSHHTVGQLFFCVLSSVDRDSIRPRGADTILAATPSRLSSAMLLAHSLAVGLRPARPTSRRRPLTHTTRTLPLSLSGSSPARTRERTIGSGERNHGQQCGGARFARLGTVGRSAGWPAGRPVGRSVGRSVSRSVGRSVGRPAGLRSTLRNRDSKQHAIF